MRPAKEYGVLTILETQQELEVFDRYLNSTAYLHNRPGFGQLMKTSTLPGRELDVLNPVGQAFHYQIDELSRTEFLIHANEKELALNAARHVLKSMNLLKQVKDRVSGRHQAAKDILRVMTSL